MIETDILIIGGGPAGMVASATSRQYYPDRKVTVVKKFEKSLVPCGIPYIFGNMLESPEDDMIPCGDMASKMGVNLVEDEIISLNFNSKTAKGESGESYKYDKGVEKMKSI